MSALFACFTGSGRRRSGSIPSLSEVSDFTGTNGDGFKEGCGHIEVVYVELLKRDKQPLGLVLAGGTDRGMQVQVAELRSGGVAEQSNALQIGDHIRSINGTVTDHLTNVEVTHLLESAGNVVNLEIAFDALPEGSQKIDDDMELKTAFIALLYEERTAPGFVISGGRFDNRPITVSHVKPGSYPYKKGVLRVGDRILQINGHDMRNASQTDFINALKQCNGESFTLQIEYDVMTHECLEETPGPLMVELQKPEGASLGISLSGGQTTGEPIYISRVRDAGIADRSGALHVGDHLLSINGQQLEGCTLHDARLMLANAGINVILEMMSSHNLSDRTGGVSRGEDRLSDSSSRTSQSLVAMEYERRPSRLSLTSSFLSTPQPSSVPMSTHPETMVVELVADDIGFGMGLGGGAIEDMGVYPITVSSIEPNGPAERLGQLLVGDRVIAINDHRLYDETLQQALKLVHEGEDVVRLEIEFDVQDPPPYNQSNEVTLTQLDTLQWGIVLRGNKDRLWIASLVKGGIAHRQGCFQPGDILVSVNGSSVAGMAPHSVLDLINVSGDTLTIATKKETINSFRASSSSRRTSPQSKAPNEAVIYSVELNKGNQSLGISLHGSERPGQPIIISHIKEGGVAHRTRALRVGDRVLAINGESLLSKSLDDAVRVLQSAGSTVTLKISKGVVSRRRSRNRVGSSTRNHRNQRYRFGRGLYPPRVSSRVSHTSDSELSTCGYITESSVEHRPSSNMRHSPRGFDIGRKQGRHSDVGVSGLPPGHYSPNTHRHKYSPVGKGRNSPVKDMVRGGTVKNGSIPSGMPAGELSGARIRKRDSFTETTDEETVYDEDFVRPRGKSYDYVGTGTYYSESENGTESVEQEWNHRLPRIPGSLGRERRKVSDRSSPPFGRPNVVNEKGVLNHEAEEAILKQLEDALLKSKKFENKLTELANQSGSSDPDSDSEPLRDRIRPHLKQHLLKHVRELIQDQHQVDLIDVTLVRSSVTAGFGLSLSDGLLENGVYVNQIQPGGPADIGGLSRYDKIIKFNDTVVEYEDCCKVKPMFSLAGEEVSLTIARNTTATSNGAAAHSSPFPVLIEGREIDYEEESTDVLD